MTRRKLFAAGSVALSGLTSPAIGTATSSTALAGLPPAGLTRLALNENPFGPSPLAVDAIRNALPGIARYASDDARALEQQIADREGVSPDQVIIGELLDALGLQLALGGGPGGEFIYSEPGYTALVDAVAPGGGVVVGVPLNAHLENDLPAIAARVTARTRSIYLVNPHNPTGTVTDAVPFKAFLREIAERTLVIVDEAYLEFEPDFAQQTVMDLTRGGANVVVFRTFGKIYGLAGISIGYAVAPKALAASLKRSGLGAAHSLNRLALAAAAASLRDAGYVDEIRLKVVEERQKWHELLDTIGRRRTDSKGTFVFFETGKPHELLAAELLDEGIEIARPFPPLDRRVRISIGLPAENARARNAIQKLLG
jgi:histidinol-phosphate aminotransferase